MFINILQLKIRCVGSCWNCALLKMLRPLVCLLSVASVGLALAKQCEKGDTTCFCENNIGGVYKTLAPPLLSACQLNYVHQGLSRYVHIYLPPSYDGTTTFPLWVHLHGVFWTTMGDIAQLVGHPINGTDVIPVWDKTIELYGDKAMFVYPQSLGDPGTGNEAVDGQGDKYRQFWHIPFWQCSVGICRPEDLDDVGFIEQVLVDLPTRVAMTPGKYYLSGESAGGMMVETLLCQSKVIADTVTATVDILGGIGADYGLGPACASSAVVPYLHLHGVKDPSITYDKRVLVDGVNFLSAIENTQLRAKEHGCLPSDAGPETPKADGNMLCTDYCAKAQGKPIAELCGIVGAAHDTDHPYPGFVYQQSWDFFERQAKLKAAPATTKEVAAAATAPNATRTSTTTDTNRTVRPASLLVSPSPIAMKQVAEQPMTESTNLTLVITITDATVEVYQTQYAAKALSTVSAVTGVPKKNITVTYTPVSSSSSEAKALYTNGKAATKDNRQHRRHLLAAPAAAEPPTGVISSYTFNTPRPGAVTAAVTQALDDGTFLAKLQDSGLVQDGSQAGPDSSRVGPTVSLLRPAVQPGSQDQVLIEPTSLLEAIQQQAVARRQDGNAGKGSSDQSSSSSGVRGDQTKTAADGGPSTSTAASSSSSSSVNVGAVVGGVIGGVVGAALLVGAIWWAAAAAAAAAAKKRTQRSSSSGLPPASTAGVPRAESSDAIMSVEDGGAPATKMMSDLI